MKTSNLGISAMAEAFVVAITCQAGFAFAADVHVGVNIGVPPPIVLEAPPRLVPIPGAPAVSYAPDVQVNVFSYGGRYYALNDGGWYSGAPGHGGWVVVPRGRVPGPVLAVPAYYRRTSPGHWERYRHHDRHHRKPHEGHGKGHRKHH